MAGSKYTIQFGVQGVQSAVASVNKVRNAQHARAQTAAAERQFAKNLERERIAAEKALPPRQRLKNLDAERVRNAQRLEEVQRKLQAREARGVASPFLKQRVATLKLANQEIDKQIRKVRQLQREQGFGGKMLGMMRGGIGRIAGALGLSGLGVGYTARRTIGDVGRLSRQAGTIGVEAEFLQEFQFGAEQAGMTADQAAMGMQRFARRLAQAQQGGGELLPQLQQMGISLTDAAGRAKSTEQVMREYADGITRIQDPQAQLLAGFKAFDSEGAALVNVLRNGAAGLDDMAQKARASGGVIENDVVARLAAADARLVGFGRAIKVNLANVLDAVIPAFDKMVSAAKFLAGEIGRSFEFIKNIVQSAMIGEGPQTAFRILEMQQRVALNRIRKEEEQAKALRAGRGAVGMLGMLDPQAAATRTAVAAQTARPMADSLARIGGFRGGSNDFRRQLELLQRQQNLTESQLRELQRISRNTDGLI
jgi:hypothetical protein